MYILYAAAAAKSLQSCPTLLDLIDGSPPGSFVPGILQARILEGVATYPPLRRGNLLNPGIKACFSSVFLHWQAGSLPLVLPGKPNDGEHLFTALLAI